MWVRVMVFNATLGLQDDLYMWHITFKIDNGGETSVERRQTTFKCIDIGNFVVIHY
jgi:hypothetical protein